MNVPARRTCWTSCLSTRCAPERAQPTSADTPSSGSVRHFEQAVCLCLCFFVSVSVACVLCLVPVVPVVSCVCVLLLCLVSCVFCLCLCTGGTRSKRSLIDSHQFDVNFSAAAITLGRCLASDVSSAWRIVIVSAIKKLVVWTSACAQAGTINARHALLSGGDGGEVERVAIVEPGDRVPQVVHCGVQESGRGCAIELHIGESTA